MSVPNLLIKPDPHSTDERESTGAITRGRPPRAADVFGICGSLPTDTVASGR